MSHPVSVSPTRATAKVSVMAYTGFNAVAIASSSAAASVSKVDPAMLRLPCRVPFYCR